jgi:hypothetical protein
LDVEGAQGRFDRRAHTDNSLANVAAKQGNPHAAAAKQLGRPDRGRTSWVGGIVERSARNGAGPLQIFFAHTRNASDEFDRDGDTDGSNA